MNAFERTDFFVKNIPLCQFYGIFAQDHDDGVTLVLPSNEKLCGDFQQGIIHGGAVSVLLDTSLGAVAVTHVENTQASATLDLRIDYMRPANIKKPLLARAQMFHTTKHVAFVRGRAWQEHYEKPIAMAAGTFTFSHANPAPNPRG